jgi:hypothetical protein
MGGGESFRAQDLDSSRALPSILRMARQMEEARGFTVRFEVPQSGDTEMNLSVLRCPVWQQTMTKKIPLRNFSQVRRFVS